MNVRSAHVQKYRDYCSPYDFELEHGTVKIHLPRQQGHTTAAMELIAKYPGSIMFVPRHNIKQDIENKFKEYIIDPNDAQKACKSVLTLDAIKDDRLLYLMRQGAPRPFTIFDGVSRMNEALITEAKFKFGADIFVELQ